MQDYICINGKQIPLTDDQVMQIQTAWAGEKKCNSISEKGKKKLEDIPVGGLFKLAGYEFIVLEHTQEGTAVISKGIIGSKTKFGEKNDYKGSYVEAICNSLSEPLEQEAGEDAIVGHVVDLTSDDGLDDYGMVKCKVSLMTADQYRKYVRILDKHKVNDWWWLATPFSTYTHDHETCVKCVSPAGDFNFGICNYVGGGVRPFCILKSSIFVSYGQ